MTDRAECFHHSDKKPWTRVADGVDRQVLGYDQQLMLVAVRFEKGAVGALHSHPHRQVTFVSSGSFEVEIDGQKRILSAGDSFFVPSDLKHGVVAQEAGVLVDVFHPMRDEFVQ